MDMTKFDALARGLGSGLNRRSALRGLAAGALSVTVGGSALDADARRRRKTKKKKNRGGDDTGSAENLANGAFCQRSSQCGPANNICAVAVNASNSDKTCCGATGAVCGAPNGDGDDTAPFCCAGYDCFLNTGSSTGVCQLVPDVL
jgi:hypothetical protein